MIPAGHIGDAFNRTAKEYYLAQVRRIAAQKYSEAQASFAEYPAGLKEWRKRYLAHLLSLQPAEMKDAVREVVAPLLEAKTMMTKRSRPEPLPINQRYGVTVPVAAMYIGISRSRIYELLKSGDLEGKVVSGRRIVLVESMMRMIGEAPSAMAVSK